MNQRMVFEQSIRMLAILGLLVPGSATPKRFSESVRGSQQETDDADIELESSLESLREMLARRRWKEAESALLALLTEQAGAEPLRPHLPGLREDLRRAAFWKNMQEPDLDSLVEGELLRYEAKSGSLKLRYRVDELGQFERAGRTHVHPAHFADSWTIEVEGTPEEVSSLALLVKLAPNDGYLLRFGRREKGDLLYLKHAAHRLRESKLEELPVAEPKLRKSSRPTVVGKIEIGRNSIRMAYGSHRVAKLDKQDERYGSLVLIPTVEDDRLQAFGTITIEGKVDRGWIGGLLDEAVGDQRSAFEATWQDPEIFDAWGPGEAADSREDDWSDVFARLGIPIVFDRTDQRELFEKLKPFAGRKTRLESGLLLKQLDQLPSDALSPSALAFLRMHCAIHTDRPTLALEQFEALDFEPDHQLDLDLARALLLRNTGRLVEARTHFEGLVAAEKSLALAYAQLVEIDLLLGEPEVAKSHILQGRRAFPSSGGLRTLESTIAKASKGPAWERVIEEIGDHFIIRTDGDRKLAREARRVADQAWERCVVFFGPLPESVPTDARTLIHLFAGESSYLNYVQGVADPSHENSLGVYSPLLKQIAVWNQPDVDDLWDTLRHETAHRYLELSLGLRTPRWLNEGLAEVFAACWDEEGDFLPGGMRNRALAVFARVDEMSELGTFATISDEGFLKMLEVGYAQAWALTHFLRFGGESDRRALETMLEGIRSGEDPQVAIFRALDALDLKNLQKRFLEWLSDRVGEWARGG